MPRQSPSQKSKGAYVITDPLEVMGCFNSEAPEDMEKDCTHPKNYAKDADLNLEYHQKRRRLTRYTQWSPTYLSSWDRIEVTRQKSSEEDGNDAQKFESVISHSVAQDPQNSDTDQAPSYEDVETFGRYTVNKDIAPIGSGGLLGGCIA